MQTDVHRRIITRQQLLKGYEVLPILKRIVAVIMAVIVLYSASALIYSLPTNLAPILLGVFGFISFIIGILSNLRSNGPHKAGVINRAELYGMVVLIFGAIMYLNNRIDQVILLLAQK